MCERCYGEELTTRYARPYEIKRESNRMAADYFRAHGAVQREGIPRICSTVKERADKRGIEAAQYHHYFWESTD